ncbi:MAG: U32 family peptidase [Bacilli bacterium]|nr:U32 family peptidase [Bacilli bacterium]
MKILVEPLSLNHLYELDKKDIGGFIVGIEGFSIFQSLKLDVDDIKNINTNKELYVFINKPIHNNELDSVKDILISLSKMNISGVLFEDIAIYKLNKDLKLNLNLIWASNHLPTNTYSCNYWNKKGCSGALLSTELMVSDFIDIKKNTNMNIFVYLYGYIPIFESSRTLITNYLKHINKECNSNKYFMYEKERDRYYPIYEEYGNTFITEDILNGINVVNKLKDIDYIVLNSLMHEKDTFNNVVDEYIEALDGKIFNKKDVFTGFLFKESIFKVKE